MLKITIPSTELFDELKNEFVNIKGQTLSLEHSLVSLSKWESRWNKPFLVKDEKSIDESIDYIRCMTITQNVDPMLYLCIDSSIVKQVEEYIAKPMTATTFTGPKKTGNNRKITTAEEIYYSMIAYNIPFECQKWHLNRLITLINVCSIKNEKPKKMSNREIMSRNTSINAARRKALNSNG